MIAPYILAAAVAFADGSTRYGDFGLREDNSTIVEAAYASDFAVSHTAEAIVFDLRAKSALGSALAEKSGAPTFGVWPTADMFEIFLAPPGGSGFTQFAVACNGSRWNSRNLEAGAWLFEHEYTADGWRGKVTIPFAALGVKCPVKGDKWRVNVARDFPRPAGKIGIATWAPVGGLFNNPAKFGDLYFCAEKELVAARQAKAAKLAAEVRAELAAQGLEREFAERLAALERGAPEEVAIEIRDEAKALRHIRSCGF